MIASGTKAGGGKGKETGAVLQVCGCDALRARWYWYTEQSDQAIPRGDILDGG